MIRYVYAVFVFCSNTASVLNPQATPKCNLSFNKYADPKFEFYDKRLVTEVQGGNREVGRFFTLLSLCHTVMPEVTEDGKIGHGFGELVAEAYPLLFRFRRK